jgi:hypothetical protein
MISKVLRIINGLPTPILFSEYRWYRKILGGRWERWVVDWPVCSTMWFEINCEVQDLLTYKGYGRPSALCRGPIVDMEYFPIKSICMCHNWKYAVTASIEGTWTRKCCKCHKNMVYSNHYQCWKEVL